MSKIWLKIRFLWRLTQAILHKHKKIIFLGFVLGISTWYVLPLLISYLENKEPRIGIIGRYTLDDLPDEVLTKIGHGLTKVNEKGEVTADLAEKWEIGNAGREYVFTLKENLKWNDNRPILAKDIQYLFTDVSTEVLNDREIKFVLREAYSPFPLVVSQPILKKGLIGNGDYIVTKVKLNGRTVDRLDLQEKNGAQRLIYRFYPTEALARLGFKLGEINRLQDITDPAELGSWQKMHIDQKVDQHFLVAVFFNTRVAKLENKALRQALAYAINKNWSNRAFSPLATTSTFYNANVKHYDYDLENAQQLWKKANEPKEVELGTTASLLKEAEKIKGDWEKLGIITKIKLVDSLQTDFEALLISQEIPQDPDQYYLWHSTQAGNIGGFKSPKIDKLLEDGRKTADLTERREIYLDFQKTLVEETPAIFLFYPTLYTISRI